VSTGVEFWVFIAAAVAGGFGAGARYVVDALVTRAVFPGSGAGARFPVGILIVNVSGSFLIGVLTGLGADVVGGDTSWIIGVGLLGGYTTFSTASLDSLLLLRAGQARRAWINTFGTLLLCVLAAAVGLALGRLF